MARIYLDNAATSWPKPEAVRDSVALPGWRVLIMLLGMIGLPADAASEPGFRVLDAASRLEDGVHRVDAHIDFAFSDDAIEAMANGVAITISVHMHVQRERTLLNQTIAEVRARYKIQAHSLSQRFLVTNLSTDETMTFLTYEAMRQGLGSIF